MTRFNILVGVLLLSMPHFFAIKGTDNHVPENFSKYFCIQIHEACPTSGISLGDPVCGYDSYQEALKTFENRCAMIKENCKMKTVYFETNMTRCKAREEFLEIHGNSSVDWAHGHDGFNIPILNLTESIVIHNASNHHDFFKLIPGLIEAALRKGRTRLV